MGSGSFSQGWGPLPSRLVCDMGLQGGDPALGLWNPEGPGAAGHPVSGHLLASGGSALWVGSGPAGPWGGMDLGHRAPFSAGPLMAGGSDSPGTRLSVLGAHSSLFLDHRHRPASLCPPGWSGEPEGSRPAVGLWGRPGHLWSHGKHLRPDSCPGLTRRALVPGRTPRAERAHSAGFLPGPRWPLGRWLPAEASRPPAQTPCVPAVALVCQRRKLRPNCAFGTQTALPARRLSTTCAPLGLGVPPWYVVCPGPQTPRTLRSFSLGRGGGGGCSRCDGRGVLSEMGSPAWGCWSRVRLHPGDPRCSPPRLLPVA